jgi:formate dehydrogenase iron-sulfur subunit
MSTTTNRKALLISPELCIGCRGCQTACKSWNQLPGRKTKNTGTMQNPPDISARRTISSASAKCVPGQCGALALCQPWCMHCDDAGCMKICPAPGALYKTEQGAVAFDKDKCIGCKLCVAGCPFDVPRYDEQNKIGKCDLCASRIAEGLSPACTKTCPTGATVRDRR